jgi:autotransporter-associated beta strand protein
VNIGTTASRAGELRIGASTNASGKFDVQGGAVTIGTGATANKIYFFKAGSSAGYTATMTQSGGTVTANGIQFCEVPATLDPASSATLQLSGGSLYVGAQGVTLAAGASALPVTIQLQGGTLGANQNWSSSMDMKLGTTGGGPTIRAQNSASTARNITLSGILSDDTAVNGTFTKTGSGTLTLSGASANTFTGPTLVSAGTLDLGKASAVSSSSSVTIANGAALALSTSSSTVPNLTFTNTGTLSFDVAGGYSLTVSGTDGVTNSGAASSVTINITGSAPADGTYTLISYSGALQGSGFSAYTLGSTPAGKSYALNDTGSAVELIVSNPFVWTGLDSTEWSTNIIAGLKNWTQGGIPTDYANGQAVVFDDTATSNTVDISVADVTPSAVTFNNSGTNYTLQGSNAIAGSTSLTKTGTDALTILNANSYTGGSTLGTTVANEGTVGIGHNSALGSGKITSLGAQLQAIGGARTLTNALDISAGGLRFGGGNDLTLSGAITMLSSRDISIYSATNTLTLSGGVNLSGFNLTLSGNAGNVPNGTMVFSAPIAGSGNFALSTSFSNGVAILSASNTYIGTTTIGSGTLRLGASGVIPDGAGSGTVTVTGTLDLNSFSETINGLSGAGIVDTIAGGTPTLTVGSGNATSTFTGIIQNTAGTLALVKTGTGLLVLQATNTFAGGATIKNGTLESKTTTTTLGTGTVVMGGAGSSGATYITGQSNTNAFTINAPDSGTNIIGANGSGSGFFMTGPVTLNGDLMVQSYFSSSLQSSTARPILNGGITGTGNLILNNLSGGTNTITLGVNPINHTGSITAQGGSLGSNIISAVIGANVTGVTQNSATSPLILSATNTYTGPTIVNAGTLVIQVASLAASSTVSVAANAVLQLDFTTTNVVAGFITNGVSLPAGVYNAANVAPFIAGLGSLEVAAAGPSGPATLTNSVSGSTLTLTWPAGQGWTLKSQTNSLSSGLNPATNAWFTVPGGVDGSNSIPINPANPTVFYRLVYP